MKAYILVGLIAFAITFLTTPMVAKVSYRFQVLTPVRARDVHTRPTPRLGGVAMLFGFAGTLLICRSMPYFATFFRDLNAISLIIAATAICLLGVFDDLYDLPWYAKLAGQFLIAGYVAWRGFMLYSLPIFGVTIGSGKIQMLITALLIVASMNAVNFVDGLDGLAAGIVGIGAFSFFLYAYLLIRLTETQSYASFAALVSMVLVGICAGFLTSNFHPASIFMGDCGSMLLGLLFSSAFILVTGQIDPSVLDASQWAGVLMPILLPIAVMLIPLLDMSMAVIRRVGKGKSPFHPDKQHLHHRLLGYGNSHRQAVATLYMWALWFGGVSVCMVYFDWRWVLLGATILGVAGVLITWRQFLFREYYNKKKETGNEQNR